MRSLRVAVLGLGEFGETLAVELSRLGCEVIAVDRDASIVEAVKDRVAHAASADVRQAEAMRELFGTRPDVGVIAMGDRLEASILAVLHLQELEVQRIVVEVTSADNAEVMRRLGADEIVSPERDSGRRVARHILNPGVLEDLRLAPDHSIVELEAPEGMHGKTVGEIVPGNRARLMVVAHFSEGELTIAPEADTPIRPGDRLTLIGRDEDLSPFRQGR